MITGPRGDWERFGPGERWDVLVEATEVGGWAFTCHRRNGTHAESARGMFGMVTAMIVNA